jgi:hypothetical protein
MDCCWAGEPEAARWSRLLNQLLQKRRHAGADQRHGCRRLIHWRAFGGTFPLSVLLFVQGKSPAEDSSGFGLAQWTRLKSQEAALTLKTGNDGNGLSSKTRSET